MERGTNEDES
ncbi:hypothetical protein SPV_2569 [Streptococcus pneumoniae]|nr:hypothetical protein SPV_2569 [Streptococcus pneumoniae]